MIKFPYHICDAFLKGFFCKSISPSLLIRPFRTYAEQKQVQQIDRRALNLFVLWLLMQDVPPLCRKTPYYNDPSQTSSPTSIPHAIYSWENSSEHTWTQSLNYPGKTQLGCLGTLALSGRGFHIVLKHSPTTPPMSFKVLLL